MGKIRMPKIDFTLSNNPDFFHYLEGGGVSVDEYEEFVQPFLESLEGSYEVGGPRIRNFFGFPRSDFCLDGISLFGTRDYVSGESNFLKVPIRDLYSREFEEKSRLSMGVRVGDPWMVTYGLETGNCIKQEGSIEFRRHSSGEGIATILKEPINIYVYFQTGRLSGVAISRILG